MKKLLVLIISILMIIPLVNTSIVLANEDCKHSFNGVEIDLDKIYSEKEANNLGFTNIAGTTSYVFICDNCNANLIVNQIEEPKEDVTEILEFISEDESATITYTLTSDTEYTAIAINKETGDTIELNGSYVKENNTITFYLANEVLFKGVIVEGNKLIEYEEETVENENLKDTEKYLELLEEIKEISKDIAKWIIGAIISALTSVSVGLIVKKIVKKAFDSVKTAEIDVEGITKESKEEIKGLTSKADTVLASLEKSHSEMMKGFEEMKAQLKEENRKNNEQMQKANAQVKADIDLLKTAIPYMAGGMSELVRNGIAESVYDLLKKGEVNEESEEI